MSRAYLPRAAAGLCLAACASIATWVSIAASASIAAADGARPAPHGRDVPTGPTATAGPTAGATASGVHDPDGTVRFPSLRVRRAEGVIEADGRICLQQGLLEVVACAAHGKVHESLIVLDCRPVHLHAALLLLGLVDRPGQVRTLGDIVALEGERVAIEVSWTGPSGATVTSRVEDMIMDEQDGTTMPRVGFVFTGSRFLKVGDRELFGAQASGQMVTVYHDPDAILDNPLLKGGDDTVYRVNSSLVPRPRTPVLVRLRRLSAAEAARALDPPAPPTATARPR